MKFSICLGGLKYNIDCLTKEFYENNGKDFECPYSKSAYDIKVDSCELTSFPLYNSNLSIYYNETAFILEKVIRHCLNYSRMIIHGAAISFRGNGFIFAAPSGTGKTTHIRLWKKYLGDEMKIVNGDKPMLLFDDRIYVCGTPWKGKELLGDNISVPLKAFIVIKQSKTNSFKKLTAKDAVLSLLPQCFCVTDKECGPKIIRFAERLIKDIPVFLLECDISKEAFDICYDGLFRYNLFD